MKPRKQAEKIKHFESIYFDDIHWKILDDDPDYRITEGQVLMGLGNQRLKVYRDGTYMKVADKVEK